MCVGSVRIDEVYIEQEHGNKMTLQDSLRQIIVWLGLGLSH